MSYPLKNETENRIDAEKGNARQYLVNTSKLGLLVSHSKTKP